MHGDIRTCCEGGRWQNENGEPSSTRLTEKDASSEHDVHRHGRDPRHFAGRT